MNTRRMMPEMVFVVVLKCVSGIVRVSMRSPIESRAGRKISWSWYDCD